MKHPISASLCLSILLCASSVRSYSDPVEALGPSSRRTGLVISEIMYHPAPRADAKDLEYIELYNSQARFEDLSGYRITGTVSFKFPPGTVLEPESFLVIARNPVDMRSVYGIDNVIGGWKETLRQETGLIRLQHRTGAVFLEAEYSALPPWPAAGEGTGHSLVLAWPSFGETNPRAWGASQLMGGSPGKHEPADHRERTVLINEIFANPSSAETGFVELHNRSRQPADLGGASLSDVPAVVKFVFSHGTTIPPGGFVALDSEQLGFAPDPGGGAIYLRDESARVIDAVRYGPQVEDHSWGRFPDGAKGFVELRIPSAALSNPRHLVRGIVINEIMYNPISRSDDDQFVELFNRGPHPVNLEGWAFIDGIRFTFPPGAIIPAGGYVVIARNASRLIANYPDLNGSNTFGNFQGSLSNRGERLALAMPHSTIASWEDGMMVTRTNYMVVNELTYGTGGSWGQWSDGGGSSLELIDPNSDNQLAANWADSDESAKAPWKVIEVTGRLDHGVGSPDQLQLFLQDPGECLVDDVEVLSSGGINLVANSTFEPGLTGWVAEGTQENSGLADEGYLSGRSLHIRASRRGDDMVNRIRTNLITPLQPGQTATIRAKVRWLRGFPSVLFRLRGNYLEAIGEMSVPANLGTPGARNSRAIANAPPAIYDVRHHPILPAANEPVTISARVRDADGISAVMLRYRVDPSNTFQTVSMTDDGVGGDFMPNDGVFSATIPGQPLGALIAFHIVAADGSSTPATSVFPNDAPSRECLVRFGETQPAGTFGTYRLWMTKATFDRWVSQHKLSNTRSDVTFVYNNERVIYNAQAVFAGSPYISPSYNTPTGNLCGYTVELPDDDRFLGASALVLDWPGRDNTAIEEQLAYWIAEQLDLTYNYRRYIHLHVNGVTGLQRGSVYEDVQQPGADILRQWVPNDRNGDLYKIERWFEFSNAGRFTSDPQPTLQNFTTTDGEKKLARYRWNWRKRATKAPNDYTTLFNLVDAVNAPSPEPYTSASEGLIDIEQWMRVFAVQHMVVNFDSYGHIIGKNMYAYKPEQGKWLLFPFDIDWVMRSSANHGYTASSPLFNVYDPVIARMYQHPPFRRAFLRAVHDAVHGPLLSGNIDPVIDSQHAALVANGINRSAGQPLGSPAATKNWLTSRRQSLLQQLASVSAPFAISNPSGSFATDQPVVTLTGTAPVEVKDIRINGLDYPVTWTTVTNWSIPVALQTGANVLQLNGSDSRGRALPEASSTLTVNFTGADPTASVQIFINEWMASNSQTIADPADGEFDDWFELYNPSDKALDLSGYTLTDNLNNPRKFLIPNGFVLPPHAFVLVWADGQPEQNAPGRDLHVNFRLDREGEEIGLFAPNGRQVDAVVFGPQTGDVSQGRWPDGAPEPFAVMSIPTPGQPNSLAPNQISLSATLLSDGLLLLTWNSEPGRSYQVESKDQLAEPSWHDAGRVTATNAQTSSAQEIPAGPGSRFFRIVRID
jgi:hypothetical protein